jgi:hypothetical protein
VDGNYLIPANTKRGRLIFGVFEPIDAIMFGTGIVVSLILLAILPIEQIGPALIALAPALITGLLVLPVANYHNVRQLLIEIYTYFTKRNKFIWKGWCFTDESEDTTK